MTSPEGVGMEPNVKRESQVSGSQRETPREPEERDSGVGQFMRAAGVLGVPGIRACVAYP